MFCDFQVGELTSKQLNELMGIAKLAASRAAELINECMDMRNERKSTPLQINEKSSSVDLVTQYDKKCEDIVRNTLVEECRCWRACRDANEHVKFEFQGEESDAKAILTDKPTWIVDPIDGTTSFIHGSFDCGVSIGLCVRKQPVLGVVNLPRMGEIFTAIIGMGAFLNDEPIHISDCKKMENALLCIHIGYNRSDLAVKAVMNITKDLMLKHKVHGIRNYGSAAMDMCSVACGRIDMYLEAGLETWDMCAGAIIAREAGAVLLGLDVRDETLKELEDYVKMKSDDKGKLEKLRQWMTSEAKQYNITSRAMVVSSSADLAKVGVQLSRTYGYRDAALNKTEKDGSKL